MQISATVLKRTSVKVGIWAALVLASLGVPLAGAQVCDPLFRAQSFASTENSISMRDLARLNAPRALQEFSFIKAEGRNHTAALWQQNNSYHIEVFKNGRTIFKTELSFTNIIINPELFLEFTFDSRDRLVLAFDKSIRVMFDPELGDADWVPFYPGVYTTHVKMVGDRAWSFNFGNSYAESMDLTRHFPTRKVAVQELQLRLVDDILHPTNPVAKSIIPMLHEYYDQVMASLTRFSVEQHSVLTLDSSGSGRQIQEIHDIAIFSNKQGTLKILVDLQTGFTQVINPRD